DCPRQCLRRFVTVSQPVNMSEQPFTIFDKCGHCIRMHHRIVPRRNCLTMFVLGGIPRRGDVRLRALKDDDVRNGGRVALPYWIGPCNVTNQSSEFSPTRVNFEWHVICYESATIETDPDS